MKVRDIVEYGMIDEPQPGISNANVRKQTSNIANQTKRANNKAQHDQADYTIAQQQQMRSEKRKRVAPTGIPSRLLQPGGAQ